MKIDSLSVGSIGTNCYILQDEQAKVCAVIDPGEALQWTQWDMHRIGWEVCNGA